MANTNPESVYDVVKRILENNPTARDSDKLLCWLVWKEKGLLNVGLFGGETINDDRFLRYATSPESITRARRKVQELHRSLRPSEKASPWRKRKQDSKGTFIFREPI
jgi:hypothetical protein